ncbi:MAG: dihydropteroate synthase [Bacteroidia bacterium]|jgi:dihydropteroate synthase
MVNSNNTINIKGTAFNLDTPKVMGILNVTPNSFYDGGIFMQPKNLETHISKMITDGVDIVDVGGASSKPGAEEVSAQEEMDRIAPALEWLAKHHPQLPVSIDTNKCKVAQLAVSLGASIVNDISAGDDDATMLPWIAKTKIPFIAMHKKGSPKTMQNHPQYHNVVEEVFEYFKNKLEVFQSLAMHDVILDPGFGFGKTVEHNFQLLQALPELVQLFNKPVLVGFSRKSMINKVLGTNPRQALNGTTVLNTLALNKGAMILRVHDVKEAKEAIVLYEKLQEAHD